MKPAIDASTPLGSDSLFPVNTLVPRTETSNSDGILHHTTSVYSYDVMAERTSSTTKSDDKVDIKIVPETEELTTKSAMDSTSQIKEVVTTAYTTKEFTSASVSTTTSVIGLKEKVPVVTTTAMVETTTDSEDEVKSKTVPMPVQEFDETTTAPDEVFDAVTDGLPDETPAAPTTTTSAADITSGWGGSDDEGVLTTTSTQHTEFITDFIENNIIPDVRRGVDIAKPVSISFIYETHTDVFFLWVWMIKCYLCCTTHLKNPSRVCFNECYHNIVSSMENWIIKI